MVAKVKNFPWPCPKKRGQPYPCRKRHRIIGGLVLHPLSQLIAYWSRGEPNQSRWTSQFVFQRHLASSQELHILPMTLLFVVLGASVGLGFAGYGMALSLKQI